MNKTKHFKRLWGLMLLLIAMLMPQGAWAISGNGTASSPYLIANEADLRTFQQYVENGYSGIYGKLTADITLTSAWTRIGRADRRFTGYFDGQGHTISGMNLSFTAYEHGFFGFVNNATIKNFTLTGTMTSSANGNHSHGTVVGSAAGTTVIENVTSSVNLTLNHTGFTCIGGIVGHMADNTRVTGCTYTGTINLTKDSEQVGGIVGYAQNDLYITDNVFSGTITSTGTCKYLAGIAGKTDGTIEVSGCTNIGTINGGPSYDCVAGIVGYVQYQSRALITNCYFGGSLSSTSSGTSLVMGGILGAVNDEKGGNFRGLTYCFSDGTLTATSSSSTQIGGIAGVVKHKAVSMVTNNTYLSGKASRISAIDGSLSFDSSNKAITISVTAGTGGTVKKSYIYPTSTTATQLKVEATPNSGYHYVEWSDNGAQTHNVSLANNVSLTANFGAHTYGNWSTDVDATCTSDGTKHRVCTHTGCGAREDGTIAALGHGSTGYTESYSWTGNAYNNASQDTKACTFTLTCKKCSTKVVNGASLTCTKTAHVDALCTVTGSTTYQATGSYTAANSAYNYHATKTNVYTVAALGHGTTGYTESYSWTGNAYNDASKDTKACIFTLTCKNCSTKVVNGASLTCIKTAHVNATCTATGSTTYQATGSYTAANSAYNYSATKTNEYPIAALSHDYSQVVDENYLVSAATCGSDAVYHEKCSRCDTHGAEWTVTGTATGNHSYTNNTLTASPIEDGLYAYACDNGCGTHNDAHVIKDFNGEGNHLELTKDGEGNYSTSEDIILADANGFVSPVDFSAPSVTYTRTGIRNQFGTLVLPFDVNGMGADYDLYKLDQVFDYELVLRKVDKGDNGGIVPAGTPVLIRLHDDLDGNYDLTLTAASNAVSCQLAEGSKADGYQLVGTYETKELSADDYFISNNKFWSVGEMVYNGAIGVKTAPFRAYIHHSWAGAKAHTLSIRIADEDVTAVETLNAITEGDAEYYDMNGRRINSLQKGVNIVKMSNGKTIKVTIK